LAGKFINTDRSGVLTQHQVTELDKNLVQNIIKNPYYMWSDKQGTKCTYYNLNTTMTTLDESTRGNFGEVSPESPLRFNKINNFYIYGYTKPDPSLEIGEYGLEGSDITGEAIVLPFTVVPYPGDFFYIDELATPMLFEITAVNPNMIETGALMYKIAYSLKSSDGLKNIEPQVVKRYNFMIDNVGTNFACLMEEESYNAASDIESTLTALKDYYIGLFYDNRIQSFALNYSNNGTDGGSRPNAYGYHDFIGFKIYDPYLIEFLIRNDILGGSTKYIYVQHQYIMPTTFPIDYSKTFFVNVEECDLKHHIGTYVGHALKCEQRLSLLYQYPIDYYIMDYRKIDHMGKFYMLNMFDDPAFADNIKSNTKYREEDILKNIIIKYFNHEEITDDDIDLLKHLDYMPTREQFYEIPMVIYCLTSQLKNMLS